jgi:signal transduction histidine kinase
MLFVIDHLHVFLYLTALLFAGLTVHAATRPPNVVNRALALLMIICTAWVYSYTQEMNAGELNVSDEARREVMRAWMRVRFLVLPFLVPLWLMLVVTLTGHARRLTRRALWGLFAVPLIISFLSTTPGLQILFRYGFTFATRLGRLLEFHETPLGILYMAYVVAGTALGIAMVAAALRRNGPRRDLVLLLISTFIPVAHGAIIIYPTSEGVALAPLLLLPVAVAMILASVRYNLCDMAPFVARRKFFDGALEGVVILDNEGVLLEYNKAAVEGFALVGLPWVAPGTRLGPGLIPEPWDAVFAQDGETKRVFECAGGEGALWYERTRQPVEEKGVLLAWLFTIADITDRVALQEKKAEEIRRASEEERERQWQGLIRDLHDGIGPVSTTIGLLAERALRAKGAAEKDELLGQITDYAESGHVELRTMMNMMERKRMDWADIVVETRRFSRLILEPRGIGLEVAQEGEPPAEPPSVTSATSLMRIIKEAAHNTAKHSGATGMEIKFAYSGDALRLSIRDNGTWGEDRGEGRGLRHIRQRVAELLGTMEFATTPETRMEFVLPLAGFAGAKNPGAEPGKA